MGQHHDSAPSLNYTVISIDSPHMCKDGSNYLKFLLRFIFVCDINISFKNSQCSFLYSNESVSLKLSLLGPKGNPLLAPAPWVAVCKKYNRGTSANPCCCQCPFGARSAKEGKSWLLRSMGFRRDPYCRGLGQIWKMGFHAPLVSLGFQVSL